MNRNFNPGAKNFSPKNRLQGSGPPDQVSAPPSPYLEARILNLEEEHADLRGHVDTLKDMYYTLCNSVGKMRNNSRSPFVSPQHIDPVESRQSAMKFKQELEQLSHEVSESVNRNADEKKVNGHTPKANGSVPPHVRAASVTSHGSGTKSLPPHLRGSKQSATTNSNVVPKLSVDTTKHEHEPLVTDGPIDTIVRQTPAALSPPLSPTTTVQGDDFEVEHQEWKPYYLTTLASLPTNIRAKIPAQQNTTTFTFDMLQNLFGGIAWSPGLRYVNTSSSCMLKNRTYYMLDPTNEPYLPKSPGEHGAKLTTFFNKAPEEQFDNLPESTNSYTDVPMFVRVPKGRYAYFGNYSQTRWSDKLDNDTMRTRVPQHVKEHMAKELTATPREDWVTEELMKHFFPKPGYEGLVSVATGDDTTTVNSVDEEKQNKQMDKDIKEYVEELGEWEREASMKTAMIKPHFILDAFDAADADDPPALRLWWEYLECVDWKKDFYNMLVSFQARADNPK